MDLLVRLYALPPLAPRTDALAARGITVRRALASERHVVVEWTRAQGSEGWASECEVAFAHEPIGCFLAVEGGAATPAAGYSTASEALIGFACIEATARGFFGPTAVRADRRGQGVGAALLLAALHALHDRGYAYGIIGWASDVEFYRRVAGAEPIVGSEPGVYRGPLKGAS